MFEGLSKRLGDVFDRLRGRGALSEADVDAALREVRTALLEADVALPVVRQFVDEVRPKAIGADVIRSVTPGQMVIKIVNDHLVEMLGGTVADLDLNAIPPVVILMVGLQGSGKTTSSAKIAYRLSQGPQGMAAEMFGGSGTFATRRKVMMASLDTRRPAAQQQLKVLGEQTGVPTLPIVPLEMPLAITRRAMETARREGFDVLILDTAGRLAIDEELMTEVKQISDLAQPKETLLVADAMTGQDAVNVAKAFNERLAVTGIVLTRVDGDARGGAALSMRAVTGKPIKLLGAGETMDALESFDPARVAKFTARDRTRLMNDAGIVRNQLKIDSSIDNAKAFLDVQREFGSFDAYVWRFVGGKPRQNQWPALGAVPASTPESDALSKDLKKLGFRFVGSTIVYAFMQATGLVNDHLTTCPRWKAVKRSR